ncbi:MAG: carbohydrate ABC transporter permease [Chloroflexi bacterium]|nr:MAG: carbohydrate ABC transporter permease [Chloroflexota bacterium]
MTTKMLTPQAQHDRRLKRFRSLLSYVILYLVTLVITIPVIWMILSSLKSEPEFTRYPPVILADPIRWDNYWRAITWIPFFRYTWNSTFLATMFSTLTVFTSAMVGFAFARLEAPGKAKLFAIVVSLLMVPAIVTIIPQFVIFARIGLTNSYWPWFLWGIAASPFHIFLFRQFFTGIPKELEDAAEVDGAAPFRVFWQIFLPNAKPALATSFILNFVGVWGDWVAPVIYLDDAKTTLAVKLATPTYTNPGDVSGQIFVTLTLAAAIIYTIPPVIMFFLAQKNIMEGVVTTGLK